MIPNSTLFQTIKVYPCAESPQAMHIPLSANTISAGFPSPANDYLESRIDLNEELIKNPSSTFFARVSGLSMLGAGIDENDILIIDKSLQPRNGCIAVCCLDGEFTLKRIRIEGSLFDKKKLCVLSPKTMILSRFWLQKTMNSLLSIIHNLLIFNSTIG